MKTTHSILGILSISLLLTACGGSSNSNNTTQPNPEPVKPTPEQKPLNDQGRLLIINDDATRPELSLYDLTQKQTIQTTLLTYLPSEIYSSPNYRYGVLLARQQGQVNFYDSGLSLNNGALVEQTPSLLNHQLFGAAPTHYRQFNGQAAIFYDGSETQNSKFDVFTDADIAKKFVASQKIPMKHHGVAEPLGELVLSSDVAEGVTSPSLVKSYLLHGDHYHEEQKLVNPCPGLHGAASIQKFTGFGCQDGVLLVEQQGQKFTDVKLPLDVRIGTLVGHPNALNLVGISSASPDLFVIDTAKKSINQMKWLNQPETKRLKQSYSATGKYFVVLDSTGTLNIFDATTWDITFRTPVLSIQPENLNKTQLVMHGQLDEVFLNDTQNNSVIHVDLKTGSIKQRIQLQAIPHKMAWVGVKS